MIPPHVTSVIPGTMRQCNSPTVEGALTPSLHNMYIEALTNLILQASAQRCSSAQDRLDAREVVVARLGSLGQHDHDWRSYLKTGDLVVLDRLQVVFVDELLHDIDLTLELDSLEDRPELAWESVSN